MWEMDEVHEHYGKVVALGVIGGEPYRWFENTEGDIAMIPLSALQYAD